VCVFIRIIVAESPTTSLLSRYGYNLLTVDVINIQYKLFPCSNKTRKANETRWDVCVNSQVLYKCSVQRVCMLIHLYTLNRTHIVSHFQTTLWQWEFSKT